MMEASLVMKDSDIRVVYGADLIECEAREEAFHSLKYLYSDITDIRKYYIRLGFHLSEFKAYRYYEDFGYLTLEEFCDVNLGLDKSAVSRCINVYEQFNASNDVKCGIGVKTVGCAMDLSERWKNFSYTQLCEMLPLSEKDREKITPDMTVKQIREYKKSLRSLDKTFDFLDKLIKKDDDASVASTQPEEKRPFDIDKYDSTRGIVRQNVVRNCSALKENVVIDVFDKNGKFVYGNIACDLIYAKDGSYYFRLWQSQDD